MREMPASASSGASRASSPSEGGGGGGAPGGGASFYDGTDVVTLTDESFHKQVVDSDDLWFVEVSPACLPACCWGCRGG
ncbi:MAG: hypothetical protein ACKOEP_12365 [Phycisphaerales bacterium]